MQAIVVQTVYWLLLSSRVLHAGDELGHWCFHGVKGPDQPSCTSWWAEDSSAAKKGQMWKRRIYIYKKSHRIRNWQQKKWRYETGRRALHSRFDFKVARNEVENASFAQRSAHRDSRIWRLELIEPAAERKRRARGRRPTFKSAYPDPQILPQCNILSNYPL